MANIIPVRITSRNRTISYSNRRGGHNRQLVSISKPGPPVSKITPKCLVINARSIAKPNAASVLNAELSTNDVDICIISESRLTEKIQSSLICPMAISL